MGSFIILALAVSSCGVRPLSCGISATGSVGILSDQRLAKAASYIENRYDARVGFVSESEDAGSNVPDGTPCYRTFWVYSDNLWASEALKPFQPQMADNISEAVDRYINECGNSQLFEVVLGSEISTTIHAKQNVKVDSFNFDGKNYTVWADRHKPEDGGVFYDADQYADLCFYLALNYRLERDTMTSEKWFRTGESFWDGQGFLDKAANATGRFQNYKLGLHLFTTKATGFSSSIYDAVEKAAWSRQEENGGIACQSYLNGTVYGTANVETTTILLLTYNDEAIAKFTDTLKIGAYYYAWWGIPSNPHWPQGVKYTPLLGQYNSGNSTVADEQILLAMQHGIDFFTVSWIGEANWTPPDQDFRYVDQNLANGLLKAPRLNGFSFCLLYETKLVFDEVNRLTKSGTTINFTDVFINDLKYAANQYFTNPRYLRVNGDPVLFIYTMPYLYQNFAEQDVHQLLDGARQQLAMMGSNPYIIGDMNGGPSPPSKGSPWLYSMNATTCYHFSDSSTGWDQVLGNAATYYPQWLSAMNSEGLGFVPDAYPGFDNTENRAWQNLSGEVVLSPDEIMFRQMLDTAINNAGDDPKMVMITSWNEWLESTAIESSTEYGELFLHEVCNIIEFPAFLVLPLFMVATLAVTILYKRRCFASRFTQRGRPS